MIIDVKFYFGENEISSELKTLEWDILNQGYLIWVSNGYTFDFLPKPSFLGYSWEKSKTVSVYILTLNGAQNFEIYRLHTCNECNSDWLNFIHFLGYKYKIRLVLILRKGEDQALISISTILKFLALAI